MTKATFCIIVALAGATAVLAAAWSLPLTNYYVVLLGLYLLIQGITKWYEFDAERPSGETPEDEKVRSNEQQR